MEKFLVSSWQEAPSEADDVGTFPFPTFKEFSLEFKGKLPLDILRQIYKTHFEFMRALRMYQMSFNRDFGQIQSRNDVDFPVWEQAIDYLRKTVWESVAYRMTQNWR